MVGLISIFIAFYWFFIPTKRYLAVFTIFFVATQGFQLLPATVFDLSGAGISKSHDWIIIFAGLIFFVQPLIYFKSDLWRKNKPLIVFYIILIFLVFYSYFNIHIENKIIFSVTRNYLFFLLIFLFVTISTEDHIKVIKLIIYITSIASVLYSIQPFIGKSLLFTVGSDVIVLHEGGSFLRYFNNPVYMMPTLMFLLIPKDILKLKYPNLLVGVNLLALFLTQHRSLLFCLIAIYFLNLFLANQIKLGRIIMISFFGFVGLSIGNQLLGNRYASGITDLKENQVKYKDLKYLTYNELPLLSTSDFRFFHLAERTEYVLEKPMRAAFGIGLMTEESKLVKNLQFTVGTTSEDNSTVPQIATGDIAWSVFILNFGIIGTASFIILYLSYLLNFFKYRENEIVKVGFYTLSMYFFTSFYGTFFMMPFSFCLVCFFISFQYRSNREKIFTSN